MRPITPIRVGPLQWRFTIHGAIRGGGSILTFGGVCLESSVMPEFTGASVVNCKDEDLEDGVCTLYLPGSNRQKDDRIIVFPDWQTEVAAMKAITAANSALIAEGKCRD